MWVTTERSYRLTQTPFKSAKKKYMYTDKFGCLSQQQLEKGGKIEITRDYKITNKYYVMVCDIIKQTRHFDLCHLLIEFWFVQSVNHSDRACGGFVSANMEVNT